MQIVQYALIEIVHEFYAQSVIALCTVILIKFILLICIIEFNKIVSHCGNIYMKQALKEIEMIQRQTQGRIQREARAPPPRPWP